MCPQFVTWTAPLQLQYAACGLYKSYMPLLLPFVCLSWISSSIDTRSACSTFADTDSCSRKSFHMTIYGFLERPKDEPLAKERSVVNSKLFPPKRRNRIVSRHRRIFCRRFIVRNFRKNRIRLRLYLITNKKDIGLVERTFIVPARSATVLFPT